MGKRHTVIVVDDHPIFRSGLISTISASGRYSVIGEAENGVQAIELLRDFSPEIIVLDVDMPVLDGVATIRKINELQLNVKSVFLTMHKDSSILRALETFGVNGYVLKDSALNEIINCLEIVVSGGTYLSPSLLDPSIHSSASEWENEILKKIPGLTSTEKNILMLISESKTNREMADELFVAVRTVETHRYNICSKLGLSGANALLKFAIQNKKRVGLAIAVTPY